MKLGKKDEETYLKTMETLEMAECDSCDATTNLFGKVVCCNSPLLAERGFAWAVAANPRFFKNTKINVENCFFKLQNKKIHYATTFALPKGFS